MISYYSAYHHPASVRPRRTEVRRMPALRPIWKGSNPENLRKPLALRPGDTIAIVAPATPVSEEEMRTAVKLLRSKGYRVKQMASTARHGKHYLSENDKMRAKAINQAFADPDVKAIFAIEGGGGTSRPEFLDTLDWAVIRNNPKIVTGYSDVTFLLHALQAKADLVTFHSDFPWESPKREANAQGLWAQIAPPKKERVPPPIQAGKKYKCVVPGEVTGRLVGGNLSLVTATLGTPYEIPLTRKEVFFLEDWKEDYENLDRMFSQLTRSGFWDKIGGLILGEFKYSPRGKGRFAFTWDDFVRDMTREARKRGIPVGYNFPVGHGDNNRPLPLGITVHFNSKTGTLSFLESPVR